MDFVTFFVAFVCLWLGWPYVLNNLQTSVVFIVSGGTSRVFSVYCVPTYAVIAGEYQGRVMNRENRNIIVSPSVAQRCG